MFEEYGADSISATMKTTTNLLGIKREPRKFAITNEFHLITFN